jgi:hypothetical protein
VLQSPTTAFLSRPLGSAGGATLVVARQGDLGGGGGEVGEESPPVSLESDAGARGHFKFIAI